MMKTNQSKESHNSHEPASTKPKYTVSPHNHRKANRPDLRGLKYKKHTYTDALEALERLKDSQVILGDARGDDYVCVRAVLEQQEGMLDTLQVRLAKRGARRG